MLSKNENANDDMIDIIENIQEKHVPETSSGLSTIFFGGDQLTEERSRNVQIARSDGRNAKERPEGIWPKNEDWHAIRIAYDVSWIFLITEQLVIRIYATSSDSSSDWTCTTIKITTRTHFTALNLFNTFPFRQCSKY